MDFFNFGDTSDWKEWSKYVLLSLRDFEESDKELFEELERMRSEIRKSLEKISETRNSDHKVVLKLIEGNTLDIKMLNTRYNTLVTILAFICTTLSGSFLIFLKYFLDYIFGTN
jgi:hypothetical protein